MSGESGSGSGSLSGRPGYLSPEEAARRKAIVEDADKNFNNSSAKRLQEVIDADAAANKAAVGGGAFVIDIDEIRKLVLEWQAVADELGELLVLGEQFKMFPQPAEDIASSMQKAAADAHADAYVLSVTQQRDYAQAFTNKLNEAIALYEAQDRSAEDVVRTYRIQ